MSVRHRIICACVINLKSSWWLRVNMVKGMYANLSVISTRNDESKGHASKGNESYEQVTMKAGKNISNITRQVIIAGRPGRRQVAMKKA